MHSQQAPQHCYMSIFLSHQHNIFCYKRVCCILLIFTLLFFHFFFLLTSTTYNLKKSKITMRNKNKTETTYTHTHAYTLIPPPSHTCTQNKQKYPKKNKKTNLQTCISSYLLLAEGRMQLGENCLAVSVNQLLFLITKPHNQLIAE